MHADTPPSARKTWLLLAGLVAFAAIVRLIGIGVPSLWGDELYSVLIGPHRVVQFDC
jgi:hypothetical protein